MKYRIDLPRVGRFFSVPCSAIDKYIKTADADYFKVLMCLLCADSDIADEQEIAERCGFKNVSIAADGILFGKIVELSQRKLSVRAHRSKPSRPARRSCRSRKRPPRPSALPTL